MNGGWETDNLGTNETQWREWAEYFAQIVRTMRSVKGAHFLFDWNVNAGTWATVPLGDYYPGNASVDIIGLDLFDQSGYPLPSVGSPDRWTALASEPMGLTEVYAFAARHHKPLSFPEWGTVSTQGDDGNYVAQMGEFIAKHDVAYQSWFNAGDHGVYQLNQTDAPQSISAYKRTISEVAS
jgi:beta-mannanase